MFRQVTMPCAVRGRMFLHSMPGRYEEWDEFTAWVQQTGVNRLVCLAERDEIGRKSPAYIQAMEAGEVPLPRIDLPIPDYGVPRDREAFARCVKEVAGMVAAGETILIHCAGGIGRTGTFATCVLIALGLDTQESRNLVFEAGSGAETAEQQELIRWYAAGR